MSDLSARIVACGGEGFVAVGSDNVLFSEDGLGGRTFPPVGARSFTKMARSWSASMLRPAGPASYAIVTSPDLEHWTTRATGPGRIHELARNSGKLLAWVGDDGGRDATAPIQRLESATGTAWDAGATGIEGWLDDVVGHGDQFVAVGRRYSEATGTDNAMVWTSIDEGENWSAIEIFSRGSLHNVRWIEDYFLATGLSPGFRRCALRLTGRAGMDADAGVA